MTAGRRVSVPSFVLDLGREPGAVGVLVAGSVAIFAAGMDPKVLSSGMPDAQAALRQRPGLESLFLLSVLVQAGFFLIGGGLGDLFGRRRILLIGLVGLAIADAGCAVFDSGPLFLSLRVLAAASTGVVLPVALAAVAVSYAGATRATALGIAYAALGGATALAPFLLLSLTPDVGRWPSFLITSGLALFAVVVVIRQVPVTGRSGLQLGDVAGHAIWAFGLLAITGGLVGFKADSSVIRVAIIAVGVVLLGLFLAWQHRRSRVSADAAIDVRPVTVALFAGVVIAFSQTAPSLEAPLFFQIGKQYSSLLATLAIAPFVLALLVSGPVAGLLLQRYSPRTLIAGGLATVGIGDILFGQAGVDTPYLFFIVPFAAIGAGFVVGTCVRTAVIFASVPRKLPATAAALNQTSLLMGSQMGVAVVTGLVATLAANAYAEIASSQPPAQAQSAVAAFDSFLESIGTSAFGETITSLPRDTTLQYAAAYAAGVSGAMVAVGVVAVLASVVAWFAMGPRDHLDSVWEHRDERDTAVAGRMVEA